ncbi:MAG: type II secretion system F family protein, partial [Firmicutes bacterium]|nr:type II secretion system F family protein [Bacillota bacterium]
MADFSYRAITTRGTVEEGVISAPDFLSAREILKARGFTPIKIAEGSSASKKRFKKLTLQEVVYFCRQFATILTAGVSLVNGLNILRRQKLSKNLRGEVERLFNEVQTGRPLSDVMEEAEGRYPKLLVNMIATGELSGSLETVMSSMAAYYEREAHLKQKLVGLMIYPTVLVFAAVGLIIFFMNFLLPEIINMLKESGVALPAVTRLLISSTGFLQNYFLYLFIFIIAVVIIIKRASKKPEVKLFIDRLLIRLPAAGNLLRVVIHARFCRTLGILLKSGVPLLQALESVDRVIGNAVASLGIK